MSQVVGAGGEVAIGPLTLTVLELSVNGELGLLNRLRSLAKKAMGPGSFFAAAAPVIDWLKKEGRHADAAVQQRVAAELAATGAGVSDDAIDEFRRTPDGVAEEVFVRTRTTHPDVTLEELKAVVNEANAVEIHFAVVEALAPKAPTPFGSPGGS